MDSKKQEAETLAWEVLDDGEGPNGALSDDDPAPCARTYFSVVEYQGKLWIFGGFGKKKKFNDLRVYNPARASGKWRLLRILGPQPNPVYLHSAAVYGGRMWVFGGNMQQDVDEIWNFEFATSRWTLIPKSSSSKTPPSRYGHSAAICGNKMYIVGGCKQNSVYFRDAYAFNLVTMVWERLGDVPYELAYHSTFAFGEKMYIYGGYNGQKFREGLYVLNDSTKKWEKIVEKGKGGGPVPSARCGFANAVIGGYLYIFGGFTQTGHNQELWRLNLSSFEWEALESENPPHPRAYLQAVSISGSMYVIGGYDGSKCLYDFRRLPLMGEVNMLRKILDEQSVSKQVDYALEHFSGELKDCLDKGDLHNLFSNIAVALTKQPKSAHVSKPKLPFDETLIPEACNLGFTHDDCIACLTQLHKEGRPTTDLNILLDRLFVYTNDPDYEKNALEAKEQLALQREDSERAALKQKLDNMEDETNELKNCKICYENEIDILLQPCGHLSVCKECALDMTDCPICRKKISARIPVFW